MAGRARVSGSASPSVSAPPEALVAEAFGQAVERRIAVHRASERFRHYSPAALCEQVVALPAQPERRGRWWAIGWIRDGLAGSDWRVWMDPETRLLRMVAQRPPAPPAPPPARRPDGRYYDGMRRRWLMPDGSLAANESDSGERA